MAVNPLSFFVATLTIGHHMQSFGRKNAVLVGVIVMACATFMFSCSVYSRGVVGFYVVSLIANIFQGVADAVITTSVEAIVALEYADHHQEKYIGYVEMSLGAGLCFGPFFGAVVSSFLNYSETFIFFSVYILLAGLISLTLVPKRINTNR